MRALQIAILVVTVSGLVGTAGRTLANLLPRERFSDAAFTLNDASRWSQVGPGHAARVTEEDSRDYAWDSETDPPE